MLYFTMPFFYAAHSHPTIRSVILVIQNWFHSIYFAFVGFPACFERGISDVQKR